MKSLILSLILLSVPALPVLAEDWAMDGFDAVGLLQSGRPVPGRGDIATMWKGKVWHFASEENRSRFESDPRSFAPAFSGLCPVALAEGRRVSGDPRHFVVIGNRLYLLRSDRSAQQLRRRPQEILARAGRIWDQ
ncbi:YHS domain-containing (seleno)protein [Paracoccus shandongensis]|uniref:YHS domain-containing (seleno)protein n=1 Tax=Paracoccus shandongensis TaxID=2816048 RepID=UPI001A8D6BBD|nr:YHS domain-containing (seleno)protein [Paracoccus shandongensis]